MPDAIVPVATRSSMPDGSRTGLGVGYRAKSDDNIIQAQAERERQITKKQVDIEGDEDDLKLLEEPEEMRENAESQG